MFIIPLYSTKKKYVLKIRAYFFISTYKRFTSFLPFQDWALQV